VVVHTAEALEPLRPRCVPDSECHPTAVGQVHSLGAERRADGVLLLCVEFAVEEAEAFHRPPQRLSCISREGRSGGFELKPLAAWWGEPQPHCDLDGMYPWVDSCQAAQRTQATFEHPRWEKGQAPRWETGRAWGR
jgi:hypothetical protein